MKKTLEELNEIRNSKLEEIKLDGQANAYRVVVGMATCGIAAGARPVLEALEAEVKKQGLTNVSVVQTGCIGVCRLEPMVEVFNAEGQKVTYVKMTPEKAVEIVEKHFKNNEVVQDYLMDAAEGDGVNRPLCVNEVDFFKRQKRVALQNCGIINPEDIDEYLAFGGYTALKKALFEMQPQDVIDTVKASGLRGRGGGGFPTGLKWQFAANATSPDGVKFVACNADEGDPGAFMDRSVLEGDPHSIIEAMAIAAYAIGAQQGYIYVRAEYPIAVKRLEIAMAQAKAYGLLGDNIFGTDFCFDLDIRLGAGAFVCGEETALMNSIEGKRGEPRPRPPFPANKGLFERPTILNNVETYANITSIINKGAEWFSSMGTEKSKGTKVFALGGKINNTGLVEIPMGTTVREVIYDIGGGIPNGKAFKAAQTGGPSGGCIPASKLDTPIDYDNLIAIGSMMGSGGLIVMDEDNCMVDVARFFLDFTQDESCGKCPPCRIGTKRMLEILERICDGKGEDGDIERLEALAETIKASALCGLGQTAPNPVLSTLHYFRDEYKAHIYDNDCPAGACKALLNYYIDADKCKSCSLCARKCPANCISGEKGVPYVIDNKACIKCGTCMDACRFGAIYKK